MYIFSYLFTYFFEHFSKTFFYLLLNSKQILKDVQSGRNTSDLSVCWSHHTGQSHQVCAVSLRRLVLCRLTWEADYVCMYVCMRVILSYSVFNKFALCSLIVLHEVLASKREALASCPQGEEIYTECHLCYSYHLTEGVVASEMLLKGCLWGEERCDFFFPNCWPCYFDFL